ncbi:helicase [Azoarcus communis]|uniref:DEAD/DEAH box helicase n=1 Tax=Parazoarcus communis TaxID=41977 RepID=UPI001459A8CC|nr:DEAD/DEAH box helicase family protein [Parazoarcus communis]NMG46578.1 helicase [Parazoarcus communis]
MRELFEYEAPSYEGAAFPPPRPFQITAHEALREGVRQGHRRQCVMAPTGAGKLYLGLRVCHEALLKGRRALLVCDRTTLIDQASDVADRYGLSHSVIQADHWRTDLSLPFQIASVQTLASRGWPSADVIVIDECHALYKTWVDHVMQTSAAVVGLSATPFAKNMGQIFSNLVSAATMAELVAAGILTPMRIYSCTKPNMAGAATSGGEWTDAAAAERGMEIIGDVVAEWSKIASDRKTIVFGATIAHCEELCRQFNEAGVMAAVFSAHTKPEERKALLDEYKKPDSALRVLVSVEALAKGFDVPDVGCVCDCRPLRKSLSTAIQMWGRGLRASPSTGKKDCVLLDFSGNIVRFAADFERIYHHGLESLDAGERLDKAIRRESDEKEVRACPACGFSPFAGRCMSCGHEVKKKSLIEHEPGEMREIRIGKTKYADDAMHLWEQVVAYARENSMPDKQFGRAWHLFKDIAGVEPPRSFRVETAAEVPVTAAVRNKIRSLNIRFAKGRRAA